MNRLPFTKYASKALNEGREIAGYLGFKDVSSIFILLGLYGTDGSLASEVLKMHGVTRELIEEAVKEKSKMPKDRRRTVKDTPKTEYLLEIAGELAMKYGCDAIGSEHILMAMIKDGDNEAFRLLEDHKISCEGIYTDILVTAGMNTMMQFLMAERKKIKKQVCWSNTVQILQRKQPQGSWIR